MPALSHECAATLFALLTTVRTSNGEKSVREVDRGQRQIRFVRDKHSGRSVATYSVGSVMNAMNCSASGVPRAASVPGPVIIP
jgi:hypothetical protein